MFNILCIAQAQISIQKKEMFGLTAEAMAATIETNLRDMVEGNGGVRQKVLSVSKECIAQTGNRYQWNGNGNGNGDGNESGNGNGSGDGVVESEPEYATQQADSNRDASRELSSSPEPKKRGVFAQSFFNFFRPAASNP